MPFQQMRRYALERMLHAKRKGDGRFYLYTQYIYKLNACDWHKRKLTRRSCLS